VVHVVGRASWIPIESCPIYKKNFIQNLISVSLVIGLDLFDYTCIVVG